MQGSEFPFRDVVPGERLKASTVNAILNWIKRQQIHVAGAPFIQTPDGTVIQSGRGGGATVTMARIVCNGPDAEPPPTTNNYWMQCTELRGVADPDDPDEPPVTDLKVGDVFLAVNLGEQLTGTHALRVGTEVVVWQQGDSTGASRWVFCG